MATRDRRPAGNRVPRRANKYIEFNVNEDMELMAFLMKEMSGISRTRVKALLTNRVVLVDNNIQTQYNFPLKKGMRVQINKEKQNHEFRHPMLKILYEDAYSSRKERRTAVCSYRKTERAYSAAYS